MKAGDTVVDGPDGKGAGLNDLLFIARVTSVATAWQSDRRLRVDSLPTCWAWKAELVAELDAGILDLFCPLGRFFLDDCGKLGRRVADRLEGNVVELFAQLP